MSAGNAQRAEIKTMLLDMVAEAEDMKRTVGGSITDAVAGWLGSQYLLAANKKLAAAEGTGSFEILRLFVQDWALLRHGDHTAERLQLERERLKLSQRDAELKQQPVIEAGLDELATYLKANPQARTAYEHLKELVRAEEAHYREKAIREWLQQPEIRQEVWAELTRGLSPETLAQIEAELPRP